uniref:Uncharacterized protein n=1 Tax=Candidozyma auris TaxID=498019 RepID=A0A0L0NTW6_CANAR
MTKRQMTKQIKNKRGCGKLRNLKDFYQEVFFTWKAGILGFPPATLGPRCFCQEPSGRSLAQAWPRVLKLPLVLHGTSVTASLAWLQHTETIGCWRDFRRIPRNVQTDRGFVQTGFLLRNCGGFMCALGPLAM